MSYRDTAVSIAQQTPGNFLGVMFTTAVANVPAKWDVVPLASLAALRDWYEEIAGAPTLYYYLAAFDKTRGASPVGESIAPPKPGEPGFSPFSQWRPGPFVSGDLVMSDANEVAPNLFVGSKPLPGPHQDIDVIVLAAQEYQPSSDRFSDTEVIHAPIDDDPNRPMTPREIEIAVRAGKHVARRLREGRRVLATCMMGLNRSALIAALAMNEVWGMSPDEAIARLRGARGSFSMSNPNFERLLRVVADVRGRVPA